MAEPDAREDDCGPDCELHRGDDNSEYIARCVDALAERQALDYYEGD